MASQYPLFTEPSGSAAQVLSVSQLSQLIDATMHVADNVEWRLVLLRKNAKLVQTHIAQPCARVRPSKFIHAPYLAYL